MKMVDAGVEANLQSYSTVVSAFAKAGDAAGAERWLERMHEAGIKGDTISFTTVINACANAGDVERAESWLVRMLESNVEPNTITFSYNTAAKAHVARGDYRRVEELMAGLRADGLPYDDFCLATLLYTYSNAKPKQRSRAEASFRELVSAGVSVTHNSLQALSRVLG